jgi:Cu/Ag efflux protein CusF
MQLQLQAASFLLALLFSGGAPAQTQQQKVVQAQPMEAVLVVTEIDHATRSVTLRGPKGNERTLTVPPEAQNLDQVRVGSRFKVEYLEEVAVSLSKGGEPSASAGETVMLSPKGGRPGGAAARTVSVSGVVEGVDPASREVTLRGPQGGVRTMAVADDVKLEGVAPGDRISLIYTQAIALQMASTPQPAKDPAPAQ